MRSDAKLTTRPICNIISLINLSEYYFIEDA